MGSIEISKEYLRLFSGFFNRNKLLNYINKEDSDLKKYLYQSNPNTKILDYFKGKKFSELYDYMYKLMKADYRCEYVYLNEIFLNEILKKHDEKHYVITELNVGSSQADLVIVNGTTTVYEIKTQIDSFYRLDGQLQDYTRAFDNVYVIVYPTMVNYLRDFLKEKYSSVGIYELTESGKINLIRKSRNHKVKIDKEMIFKTLLKKDRDGISENYYEALEKFRSFSFIKAHDVFKDSLINRAKKLDIVADLPDSLKVAGYKIDDKLNKKQREKFLNKLNSRI